MVYVKKEQAVYSQLTLELHLLRYTKLLAEAGIWVGMYTCIYTRMYIDIHTYHILLLCTPEPSKCANSLSPHVLFIFTK